MMRTWGKQAWTIMAGAAIGLSGCAGPRVAPIAQAPAPAIPPRPVAPDNLPTIVPARTADGGYATLNHAITPAEAMWHVRAALNVAALGCRGPEEAGLIAGYNAVLARQKAPLAKAYAVVRDGDRKQYGAKWESGHDAEMTRLYNFFAQPFAKAAFCAAAPGVMTRAIAVDPLGFESFAVTAMAELEAPFLDGYRRYDAYHQELAAWDAAYGAGAGQAPQLAYAPMDTILAWTPSAAKAGQRMASAR